MTVLAVHKSSQNGKRNSGATASKARCAARPYLDMAFCTSVRQAHTDRAAEAVVIVVVPANIAAIAHVGLILDPAIDLEEAVERVVQAETGGNDIVVVIVAARVGVLVRLTTVVEVERMESTRMALHISRSEG